MPNWRRQVAHVHAILADMFHKPLRRRRGVDPYHQAFTEFVDLVQAMDAPTVLELGARNVTGMTQRQRFPGAGRYIGCDIHPGDGVDLVADIHRLSEAVEPNSVDAVFSVSVFEHLAYPWKAVLEINRVLKPGGYVCVATHPAWPAHELPWDFWRFPVGGLAQLLSAPTGFEVVRATEGQPAKIYSLSPDAPTRGLRDFHLNLGVVVIARKIADYDPERLRWDVRLDEALTTEYPRPA